MPTPSSVQSEDRIRAIAYTLWLEEGRPEGRAEVHWSKAYELVNAEAQPAITKAKRASATTKLAPRKRS